MATARGMEFVLEIQALYDARICCACTNANFHVREQTASASVLPSLLSLRQMEATATRS